jgi:hypothetical protein
LRLRDPSNVVGQVGGLDMLRHGVFLNDFINTATCALKYQRIRRSSPQNDPASARSYPPIPALAAADGCRSAADLNSSATDARTLQRYRVLRRDSSSTITHPPLAARVEPPLLIARYDGIRPL